VKQRIKVLQLTPSLSVGGAEQVILSLVNHIDKSRFDMHICCMGAPNDYSLLPKFQQLNLPLYITGTKKLYHPQNTWAIGRYILNHKIDIIHTHLSRADITGRILGRLLGRPVISTLHNPPSHYDQARFDQRWLQRLTARYLDSYQTAVSDQIRTLFIEQWGIRNDRIGTIYNGVSMEQYLTIPEGATWPVEGGGPVVINVGRLNPQKAQDKLLEAAKLVLEQRPDARFMIVGRGELEQQLKDHAQRLGIADQVIFTGVRHDIPELLAQADVFVLSSLWEGLPVAAVEAMAAARAVVLTNVGGNRELVNSGKNGLLVPPNNVEALAVAIISLLDNPAWAKSLGQAARKQIEHDFNIDRVIKQYEALYELLWHRQALPQSKLSPDSEKEERVPVIEGSYNE
jgi:glycosyltransferase involved in cell wall biosynthesis